MADTFLLEVATPDQLLVKEQVAEAQIPAANGYLGVLPGHAPLIAELGAGELSFHCDGRRRTLQVHGGFVEVTGDRTRVLATKAERPAD
jgi:F-type H+-transporting ATPase subunit epsilon